MLSTARSAARAASTTMSQAELPPPMTSTRLPRSWSRSRYSLLCHTSPVNDSGISGIRGVHCAPLQQTTAP